MNLLWGQGRAIMFDADLHAEQLSSSDRGTYTSTWREIVPGHLRVFVEQR